MLTPSGQALLEELLPQHQARVRDYFVAQLTPEEIEVMGLALTRIQANLTAVSQ